VSVHDRMCCVLSGCVKPLDAVDYIAHTLKMYTHTHVHTYTRV